jgi:mono/diheme cytochrome c family protein
MPNMTLTESEATAIAGWLISQERPGEESGTAVPAVFDPAKADRGRALFQSLGCAACHEIEGIPSTSAAPALNETANWSAGCLAEAPVPGVPWFDLSPAQRTALAALKDEPAAEPTPADIVNHTLLALNCYACHMRNGIGGPEPGRAVYFIETEALDLGDEGRLPPALTGVGAKLTPEWHRDILTDAGRIRPYMATRMPHFPADHVEPLAAAFLEVDRNPNPPVVNVSGLEHHHRNMYGRELMGVNGLGCVTCHDLDGHRSLGIPAVDLANVPRRLQPEWFMQYMLDPASLRPQTRMPDFFDGTKSLSSKLFNGDAVKQVEALWIYLKEVKETRLPEGMEDDTDYELRPTNHPIVHRTFMEAVGTRAIAVGFPGGLNFAYDARAARPALVWRGRFIDAESAQADRFTPFVRPLGEDVADLPAGATLSLSVEGPWDNTNVRFEGYRLDANRVPVFRYRLGGIEVEESLQPSDEGRSFLRRVTFTGSSQAIFLRLGAGEAVAGHDNAYQVGKVTIRITGSRPPTAGPVDIGWVVPVDVTESGTTIEELLSW